MGLSLSRLVKMLLLKGGTGLDALQSVSQKHERNFRKAAWGSAGVLEALGFN